MSAGIRIHIDGASRGNPGAAAYGVLVESDDGEPLASFSKALGTATNNFAEYQALMAALEYALKHEHRRVRIYSDSELLVRQLEGRYRVKSPVLKLLHERAMKMVRQLEAFSVTHVPREQNREADRLANRALDAQRSPARTPESGVAG
ncbi:MAG: ribonuclease HI family protein [Terriglobia bacterium]